MAAKKKKVLFVCIGNMYRSQMAEGFARAIGSDVVEAYSAGENHTGLVGEDAIAVMREKDIDISMQDSKGLRDVNINEMDVVVAMGNRSAADLCPAYFAGEMLDWKVTDPVGDTIFSVRRVRDDLEEKVRDLLKRLWKGEKLSSS
jgi:arsenate reductase